MKIFKNPQKKEHPKNSKFCISDWEGWATERISIKLLFKKTADPMIILITKNPLLDEEGNQMGAPPRQYVDYSAT